MGRKPSEKTRITDRETVYCSGCDADKKPSEFYKSYGTTESGLLPYCKKCCIKYSLNKDKSFNINKFKEMLQRVDRPFLNQLLQDNLNKYEKISSAIGFYFKDIGIPQYRAFRWKDSEFASKKDDDNNECIDEVKNFKPTKEMLIRWGTAYNPEQYIRLEHFYKDMHENNKIETPQEEDYLKKLSVISMKMDEELENGNYGQVKQLGDLFSKYMADSKFRAMDKSESDKTGGIRNFSMIYAEVESQDFIPPWEYYRKIKGLTQDLVDKCIMHMENFTCRLNKVEKMTLPPVDTPKITQEDTDVDLNE